MVFRLDWRSFHNTNYVTMTRNQNSPAYCDAGWAMATTSALSDRINILRNNKYPLIHLSPQVLLNCNAGGSCRGGGVDEALKYIRDAGLTEEPCHPYEAVSPVIPVCDTIARCKTCTSPYPHNKTETGNCSALADHPEWFISRYGRLTAKSAEEMKLEIQAHGPIVCGMTVTPKFQNYTGGVYSEIV